LDELGLAIWIADGGLFFDDDDSIHSLHSFVRTIVVYSLGFRDDGWTAK
jgi:hypothetical protein